MQLAAEMWFRVCVQPAGVRPEIVGRERERAELAAALDAARHARGGGAMLLGEAGIGKSTLADWAVTHATASGLRTARGYCSAAGMPPLWPWRRALDSIGLDLAWRADGATPTGSDREVLAASLVDAIADVARQQTLLIVLEDVQWSDSASLVVARAVADAAAGLPVMVILTCRDDPQDAASHIRDQLADLPTSVRRVLLPPLDRAEVAHLAATIAGHDVSAREAHDLHVRTGGNPFFVQEVVRLIAAHGPAGAVVAPPGVRDVLQRRLARLSQPCVAILTAAAIAAETSAGRLEDSLLAAVCGVDDATVRQLLDEAVAARLVDIDPNEGIGYRFRHALVDEVLRQGTPGSERGRLHARLAEAMEARSETPTSRLAHHWSRAASPRAGVRAAIWSLRAARDAKAEFGFDAAATHYARALADPSTDQIAVSIEFGDALRLRGDIAAAREVLLRAADEASTAGRHVELAEAALALGGGLAGFEVPLMDERQAELLKQADAALPGEEVALRAAVRGRLSLALAGSVPLSDRVRLAEEAVALAREAADARIESVVLAAYCDAIAGPDYVAERIAAGNRMLGLAAGAQSGGLREPASVLLAHRLLLVAHLELGDLRAAEEHAAAYTRTARGLRIPLYAWLPEVWRGMRALLGGDADAALQHAVDAAEIGQRAGSANAALMTFTLRMQAHLDRGTASEFAPVIRALLDEIGLDTMPATYIAAPARALLAAGDATSARWVLGALLAGDADTMPRDAEWLEAHWAMADIALSLGDRGAAAALFEVLRPYGHLWAVDGIGGAVFGNVAEQLGRLAAFLADPTEATRYLRAARERYVLANAPALLQRIESLAPMAAANRAARTEPEWGRLRRDGRVWLVEWHGKASVVPDSKGLRDLAVLLARPGKAVPAVELVQAAGGPTAASTGSDLGPVLDETARLAYRNRLADLEVELDEAEGHADLGRLERLRTERSMLADELAGALGLGGRPRLAGDPVERARKAVTMRIRAAIAVIGAEDENLARHLRNAVHTGRLCTYEPEASVRWQS